MEEVDGAGDDSGVLPVFADRDERRHRRVEGCALLQEEVHFDDSPLALVSHCLRVSMLMVLTARRRKTSVRS